jgi:hypothetical protein
MNSGSGRVVFLQGRAHPAGAQTGLWRLLRQPGMKAWDAVLVCGEPGWLTEQCRRDNIPTLIIPFPAARTWAARLWSNARFAEAVKARLPATDAKAIIVHANDYGEGLLGLHLARALRAKRALFMRSSAMTRADYDKHGCREYQLVCAVGDELRQRARAWDASSDIKLIHDGIEARELQPPKPTPKSFPRKILVIGTPLAWKGWATLTEALRLPETNRTRGRMTCNWSDCARGPADSWGVNQNFAN